MAVKVLDKAAFLLTNNNPSWHDKPQTQVRIYTITHIYKLEAASTKSRLVINYTLTSYQSTINALSVFSTSLCSSQLYNSSLPLPRPTCLLSLLLALLSPPIWVLCASFQSWCWVSTSVCNVAVLTAINWMRGLIWARIKSSSAATAPYKTMTQWAPGSSLCACVHVRVCFFAP